MVDEQGAATKEHESATPFPRSETLKPAAAAEKHGGGREQVPHAICTHVYGGSCEAGEITSRKLYLVEQMDGWVITSRPSTSQKKRM